MGLFDFVIDQGKKLFGQGDDPATKIEQEIESANPGIKNLNVEFKDSHINLAGEATSAEAERMSKGGIIIMGTAEKLIFIKETVTDL
jgi:hypothetical protein